MKKKKLLFIIWSFTYGGGAERVLATLVNNLPKEYDIDILEYWNANIYNKKINSNVHLLKPVVDSTKDSKFKKIIKMVILYTFPSILRKKYIKDNYDVEISYNYLLPTFLLRKSGKTISWIHGDIYDLKTRWFNRFKQRHAFKNVDRIVSISKNTYESVVDMYPEYKDKTIIINNSFDFNVMLEKAKEFKVENKEKNILFIGRLDENKNPLFLIEVAKLLKEDNVKFKLSFLGQGSLKDDLESKIKEYDLENAVELLGFQKNPYPYIKSADIIVGCSKSEGFPTVYVEGMLFSKPFVSTIVGGVEELSDGYKCGYVSNDIVEYKEYVKKLLLDKNLYMKMSEHAYKHVQKYSCVNQAKVVNDLICEIGDSSES